MPDREKVIKCLEACTGVTDDCAGHTCPYWDFDDSATDWGCRIQMEKDALELLKEQEAKNSKIVNAYLELVGKASKQPQIVRCKDCKWFEMPRYGEHGFCKNVELIRRTTFYCADGEAKT